MPSRRRAVWVRPRPARSQAFWAPTPVERCVLLGEPLDRQAVIDLAATIEGHPDNSTPAILGGFCVALLENGHVHQVRVPVHSAIDFIVFIPDFKLSTEKARAALPKTIAHRDAVYNLARAALLAGSLTTGQLENLDVATGDCLHQPYRFGLIENRRGHRARRQGAGRAGRVYLGRRPVHRRDGLQGRPRLPVARAMCEKQYPHWKAVQLRCDEVGATVKRI